MQIINVNSLILQLCLLYYNYYQYKCNHGNIVKY